MASSPSQRVGGNLILASLLALLSYVPFEWVARASLIVCILLFVLDPIPPLTRLVSLVATFVVLLLTKSYRRWVLEQEQECVPQEGPSEQSCNEAVETEKKDK